MREYGLRLPNGRTVWPPEYYRGYPMDTPERRAVLLEVLRKTADDLDWPHERFLAGYAWVARDATVTYADAGVVEAVCPQVYGADGSPGEAPTNGGGSPRRRPVGAKKT